MSPPTLAIKQIRHCQAVPWVTGSWHLPIFREYSMYEPPPPSVRAKRLTPAPVEYRAVSHVANSDEKHLVQLWQSNFCVSCERVPNFEWLFT